MRRKNERKKKKINKVHECRKAVHNPQINTVMLYEPELGMRDETQTLCKLSGYSVINNIKLNCNTYGGGHDGRSA